jgi:hypothetical protein
MRCQCRLVEMRQRHVSDSMTGFCLGYNFAENMGDLGLKPFKMGKPRMVMQIWFCGYARRNFAFLCGDGRISGRTDSNVTSAPPQSRPVLRCRYCVCQNLVALAQIRVLNLFPHFAPCEIIYNRIRKMQNIHMDPRSFLNTG